MLVSVIVPLKLDWEPIYSIPNEILEQRDTDKDSSNPNIEIGTRVRLKFSGREYICVISDINVTTYLEKDKIKEIIAIESEYSKVLESEIQLWRSISEYYMCSIGEVYKAAYPIFKLNREKIRTKKASKKKTSLNCSTLDARSLQTDTSVETEVPAPIKIEKTPQLTDAQTVVFDKIKEYFKSEKNTVLLEGVTASGKTEIYIKLALEYIKNGYNVLYLVPEIAISRQLEDRLKEYFPDNLSIFHSQQTSIDRDMVAERIRNSSCANLILGTRSSVFLPFTKLGLIIVDEEHDNSYKQDSPAPRYNGRDCAAFLAHIHKSKLLLGSATPSLESIYNALSGRYNYVILKEKFHGGCDTEIEIIDTKAEYRKRGMVGNISRKLINAIQETINSGEQVIILRARKTYATILQCENCGEILKCKHCNVSLNYSKTKNRLICNHCGYTSPYDGLCKEEGCNGKLKPLGNGTERIEEELAEIFPNIRIARFDSDISAKVKEQKRIIKEFAKGDIQILVGTQMLSKGFDFQDLGLVAIIGADSILGIQDYRADEKALQLFEQFKGRCGRRGKKGRFIIQTTQPEHPLYKLENNIERILNERKTFNYPPFSRIININIRDTSLSRLEVLSRSLAQNIKGCEAFSNSIGPFSPVIDKISDEYIKIIRVSLAKDKKNRVNKQLLRKTINDFALKYKYSDHIIIDVDPV